MQVEIIQGFTQYLFIDGILYKKAKKCKHELFKFQYRNRREIKLCSNNGSEGYYLYRNNKREFISLKRLEHRKTQKI